MQFLTVPFLTAFVFCHFIFHILIDFYHLFLWYCLWVNQAEGPFCAEQESNDASDCPFYVSVLKPWGKQKAWVNKENWWYLLSLSFRFCHVINTKQTTQVWLRWSCFVVQTPDICIIARHCYIVVIVIAVSPPVIITLLLLFVWRIYN